MPAHPQVIGPHEITREIGRGGMGVVYLARDTKLDRDVAIKALPEELAEDADRLTRFGREAKLLAQLNHPNIAGIHGIEEQDGQKFLILEYVEGGTLSERLINGTIPVREALVLAMQIASGIEAAHERGVIHRDLKPDNIKITEAGDAKILDFGLAKDLNIRADSSGDDVNSPTIVGSPTIAGEILGTAGYLSPEQARGRPVDTRTDIFAFGCVLFEMLSGTALFGGETVSDSIGSTLHRDPDFQTLPTETPRSIRTMLRRCLAKDCKQRLQSIGDVRIEIEEVLSGATIEEEGGDHRVAVLQPAWLRNLLASVTVLFLFASLVFGYLWLSQGTLDRGVMRFEIPPPEGTTFNMDPEIPGPAVVSPDGRMVAFSARNVEGEPHLYVRPVDTTESRMLPGTDGAFFCFWSPDSDSIGFFANGKLKKVKATGGQPISLCDAPLGAGGSWNPEGVIVFAPGASTPLHRVSEAGGESTPITKFDSQRKDNSHRHPRFLPDGRHFLYLVQIRNVGAGEAVLVGSLDDEEEKLLLHSNAQADFASGHLLFMQQRTLMAQPFDEQRLDFTGKAIPVAEQVSVNTDAHHAVFSVSANGVLLYHGGRSRGNSKLEWVDRDGKSLGSLGDPAAFQEILLSPDDTLAAVSINSGDGREIWIYDVARDNPTRFTFGFHNWVPSWSPDGRELAFTSTRSGRYGLYLKSLTGAGEETLLFESDDTMFPQEWTPDGEFLAFDRQVQGTSYDVWILPLKSDREPYPFVQTQFEDAGAAFSPDGNWMAYQSTESGRWEVYVTSFPGPGRKWQVSTEGGAWARWTEDGKELFYHGLNGQLMAVDVDVQDDAIVVGAAEALFAIGKLGGFYIFAPTLDGQRFLLVRSERGEEFSPLTLVLNWAAGLK